MARYTPNNLSGDLSPVNPELEKIKEAIIDTLSRKGDSPNSMMANIDMNTFRILNLPDAINDAEPTTLGQVKALIEKILGASIDATDLSPEQIAEIIDGVTEEVLASPLLTDLQSSIDALEIEDLGLRTDVDAITLDLNNEIVRINNIFGELDTIDTAIINETTARENADEAIVTSVNGIASQYDDLSAQLLLEQQTRATADSAIVQTIQTLQTFSATIFVQPTEPTIGVAPDVAVEGDLWYDSDDNNHPYTLLDDGTGTLVWTSIRDGQFTVLQAQVQNEQTARIDADGALAQDITDLTSVVASDKAFVLSAIQDEQTARSTADSALASDITNLTAAVNTNNSNLLAAISDEETARVDADGALASDITSLAAAVNTNNTNVLAAIQSEASTRASSDSALASQITTLTSTVNGNTASLSETATVVDGLKAQYMVKTDVNGYVSGFGLYNEGSSSEFIVLADRFSVVLPGAAARTPFVVDGSSIYLSGATIKDGDITATKLSADAIDGKTITGATFNAGTINVSSASSGQRMEMSNSRIRIYDSSNTLRVKIGDLS